MTKVISIAIELNAIELNSSGGTFSAIAVELKID